MKGFHTHLGLLLILAFGVYLTLLIAHENGTLPFVSRDTTTTSQTQAITTNTFLDALSRLIDEQGNRLPGVTKRDLQAALSNPNSYINPVSGRVR